MSDLEKATERRATSKRLVKLPGKNERRTSMKPEDIAAILRKSSKLGQAEARLDAAEMQDHV